MMLYVFVKPEYFIFQRYSALFGLSVTRTAATIEASKQQLLEVNFSQCLFLGAIALRLYAVAGLVNP